MRALRAMQRRVGLYACLVVKPSLYKSDPLPTNTGVKSMKIICFTLTNIPPKKLKANERYCVEAQRALLFSQCVPV